MPPTTPVAPAVLAGVVATGPLVAGAVVTMGATVAGAVAGAVVAAVEHAAATRATRTRPPAAGIDRRIVARDMWLSCLRARRAPTRRRERHDDGYGDAPRSDLGVRARAANAGTADVARPIGPGRDH